MFADIFSKLLQEKGVTAYRVAKDLNLDQALVGRYKKGKAMPETENLKKIADYFNVSNDYLLGVPERTNSQNNVDDLVERLKGYSVAFSGGVENGLTENEIAMLEVAIRIIETRNKKDD